MIFSFVILGSINSTFAEDCQNVSSILSSPDEGFSVDQFDSKLNELSEDSSSEDNCVIYVNQNNTGSGDGSLDNPFVTLDQACNKANNNYHTNVTVYIYEGNYSIGSQLNFNTDNLIIKGIGGKVTIKNLYNYNINDWDYYSNMDVGEAFGLTSSSSKFTLSNLIFDASSHTQDFYFEDYTDYGMGRFISYFYPFYGQASLGLYENCSFNGFTAKRGLCVPEYNSTFVNCSFNVGPSLFVGEIPSNVEYIFKYCAFNIKDATRYLTTIQSIPVTSSILMDSVWFGQKGLPESLGTLRHPLPENDYYNIPVTKYAVFNVTENYLGNNQYEIIGKLTWNGTDDQKDMENFQPMTVTLESENGGEIASTVTLVNGTFKTIYTNDAPNHKITVTLHNQDINLEFNSVNITSEPVSIIYGEDQNLTVKFSQVINSTVIITVNNKTYHVKINESDSLTYTIEDVLTEGTYIVNITLIDEENHIYGLNSTILSVSRVDTPFSPNVPAEDVKVGDTVTIQVTLPEGATGTVTVNVGNNTFTETASANTEINITGLVAGNNPIKIVYSGDNKYANKSVDENIYAEKVSVPVTNETLVIGAPTGSATPSVSINLPENAKGNLTVTVNGKNYTQELVNGSATVTLDDLPIGNHNAVVTYSGDGMYDSIIQNTTISFSGIKTSIEASNVVTTYNVAKKLVVTLKDANGNILAGQKVSIKVGTISKTLTTDAKGQASVDISKLVPKEYTATVNFAGDAQHVSTSANAKVTVKKVASKITAKKKTFKKAKKVKKYTITLKAGKKAISKVKVTLKIKGKTYKAKTTAKGKATFKIKKLTKKGKYKAVIKFKGNKYFKATTKKVKITLK